MRNINRCKAWLKKIMWVNILVLFSISNIFSLIEVVFKLNLQKTNCKVIKPTCNKISIMGIIASESCALEKKEKTVRAETIQQNEGTTGLDRNNMWSHLHAPTHTILKIHVWYAIQLTHCMACLPSSFIFCIFFCSTH